VRSAHDCNEQLQATLQTERQQALCQSRDMEARLLDAQNGLMDKVREVTAARDAQTALKSEIASLRALIESAEMRSLAATCTGLPSISFFFGGGG